MSKIVISFFLCFLGTNECRDSFGKLIASPILIDSLPPLLKGNFMDDYSIRYTITDSLWVQHPGVRYHILKYNHNENYIIARNDENNSSGASLYTRIDYMPFTSMEPYTWGFCLSVYNAKTDSVAEFTYRADKENPKKGCNGFPFSRMKKKN